MRVIAVVLVVFESRNNMVRRFAVKLLLWWVPRWEDDNQTDNERSVLRKEHGLKMCREKYSKE